MKPGDGLYSKVGASFGFCQPADRKEFGYGFHVGGCDASSGGIWWRLWGQWLDGGNGIVPGFSCCNHDGETVVLCW